MRAGALSNEEVGAYLKERYVSVWKRVGTFTVGKTPNGGCSFKAGGNIAVYFCTPNLEVVNAIAGPVDAEKFLAEARWAFETYERVRQQAGENRVALARALAQAHRGADPSESPLSMHAYLAVVDLPKLESMYRHVFEEILGEQVTDEPVHVTDGLILNRAMNRANGWNGPRSFEGGQQRSAKGLEAVRVQGAKVQPPRVRRQ